MLLRHLSLFLLATWVQTLQFPGNTASDISADEKFVSTDKMEMTEIDESGEVETDFEDKDKKFLDDAMKAVLDPQMVIVKTDEAIEHYVHQLEHIDKENTTIETFMDEMDNLSLEVCRASQEALWSYVTDANNDYKNNIMMKMAAEDDDIKKQYWDMLRKHYLDKVDFGDAKLRRKLRVIQERAISVQFPQSKQNSEIGMMQSIWSRASMCSYNDTTCSPETVKSLSDVSRIFKTSNNSKELLYYWKAYRDATGKKIRPIFNNYILTMNDVAQSDNFADAGDMWRFTYEDDNFTANIDRIWSEIKPLYNLLHDYVRLKLMKHYDSDSNFENTSIPAHLLGNLWAQEWQAVYPKVVPYPNNIRPQLKKNHTLNDLELFEAVDDYHQSLGYDSANDSYQDLSDGSNSANCLPSSHDMCDGVNYRIKWCRSKVSDISVALSKAARLLGHIQYFKHYRDQPFLYRDGPNPSFHDAISDIVSIQITSPKYIATLGFVDAKYSGEASLNHLLWLALEKLPVIAYAYVLDKWRWDIFSNNTMENLNEHWWDLRTKETGLSPPTPRNESDLDPASKYHVVSHSQYITYLVSHVLEFQILKSLCRHANYSGPLHECSLHGVKEAGKLLSDGMSLGASEDWRTVLETMTGQRELNTEGLLEYFEPLAEYLKVQNERHQNTHNAECTVIIVSVVFVVLIILILGLYCVKKHNVGGRFFGVCGLSKNGSLDIVTNEMIGKERTVIKETVIDSKV